MAGHNESGQAARAAGDSDTATAVPAADELRAQLEALQRESDAFRVLVRERAIKGFRDGDWNLASLNDSLERLGLDTYEPSYVSHVQTTLEFQVEVDDGDTYAAETAIRRQLDQPDVRQALQQAIATVLSDRAVDGAVGDTAISMTDAYFRLRPGYVDRVMT